MAQFPALTIWTDALIGDTTHLSTAEFGAYMLMLIVAWRTPDCKLPDDDEYLARITRAGRNWSRMKPAVMAFWKKDADGKWYQKRLLGEYENASRRTQKASHLGKLSALKRKHSSSANPAPTLQRPGNYPSPSLRESQSRSTIQTQSSKPISPSTGDEASKKMWDDAEVRETFDFCLSNCRRQDQDARIIFEWLRAGATPAEIRAAVELAIKSARINPRYGENFLPDNFRFFHTGVLREIENRKSAPTTALRNGASAKSADDLFEDQVRALASSCKLGRRVPGDWQSWVTARAIRVAFDRKLIDLHWMWTSGVRLEPEVTLYERAVKSWSAKYSNVPDAPPEQTWVAEAVARGLAELQSASQAKMAKA